MRLPANAQTNKVLMNELANEPIVQQGSSKPRLSVAVLSFTDIRHDGRVQRQLNYLAPHYNVTFIGYGSLPDYLRDRVQMIVIDPPTSLRRRLRKLFYLPLGRLHSQFYEWWYATENEYQSGLQRLQALQPDIIHANDWESLPLAVMAAAKMETQVISDLHEYAPSIKEESTYWRWFYMPLIEYFLRKEIGKAAATITVCQTVAKRYHEEFGFQPLIVMNAPGYQEGIAFRPCNPDQIHLAHHGVAMRNRFLELMIETIALADKRYHLHFMLVHRNKGYVEELQLLSEELAPGRITFHNPVEPHDIVKKISAFDIGIFLLPGTNFNYQAALPNKFFEFVQAGLAVFIGPSKEMAYLTRQYQFGIVTEVFDAPTAAKELNNLSASDIDHLKENAIRAREELNADVELGKLLALYDQMGEIGD